VAHPAIEARRRLPSLEHFGHQEGWRGAGQTAHLASHVGLIGVPSRQAQLDQWKSPFSRGNVEHPLEAHHSGQGRHAVTDVFIDASAKLTFT
jgi:hypothetical protein